jgi:hypothetical protein
LQPKITMKRGAGPMDGHILMFGDREEQRKVFDEFTTGPSASTCSL